MDTSSQFVQIVPGNDTVVLILLEMQMGEHRGAMSMCIPYLLIKPILGKLSAQRWLANASKKPSPLFAAGWLTVCARRVSRASHDWGPPN